MITLSPHLSTLDRRILRAAFWVIALFHLLFIVYYAVNSPFQDEWNIFDIERPEYFVPNGSLSWLLTLHGQHYIFLTRLVSFLSYHLFFMNYSVIVTFNFLVYLFLVVFVSNLVPEKIKSGVALLFMSCYLLCARAFENHLWSFQNQFHFFLLFLFVAIFFLFVKPASPRNSAVGVLGAVVCLFSFGAGLMAMPFLIAFLFFDAYRKHRTFFAPVALSAVYIFGVYYYLNHAPKLDVIHAPFGYKYWDFLLIALSHGVFTAFNHVAIGFCVFAFLVIPLFWMAGTRQFFDPKNENRGMGVALLILLATLGQIAAARSYEGSGNASVSRYTEITMFALFFAFFLVKASLTRWPHLSTAFLTLLLILSYPDWDYGTIYREFSEFQKKSQACIFTYFDMAPEMSRERKEKFKCLFAYGLPTARHHLLMERMQELRLSFYRDYFLTSDTRQSVHTFYSQNEGSK